jgi:protease IV
MSAWRNASATLWMLAMAIAMSIGCRGTVQVCTDSTVHVDPPPPRDRSPLRAMKVEPGCDCQRIVLIDVDGLLVNQNQMGLGSYGENPVDLFRERLDAAARDAQCKAVLIRINSFGGGVAASDMMRQDLLRFRQRTQLPVVALLMDTATGGGYYIASVADLIIAHPTSLTGGLGVLLNHYSLEDTQQTLNIATDHIRAGNRVDLGSPEKELEKDDEKLLQSIADHYKKQLQDGIVAARSDVDPKADFWDGRVLTANEALDAKLIDSIGYIDDAIDAAKTQAGASTATTVMLHRGDDRAFTPYAVTPNIPLQNQLLPLHLPGMARSRLPTFLYIWQPDPILTQ